jgi:hypothetical protein
MVRNIIEEYKLKGNPKEGLISATIGFLWDLLLLHFMVQQQRN